MISDLDGSDYWGWSAPIVVWIADHCSLLLAIALFVLQAIYQILRIKKVNKELQNIRNRKYNV